MLKCTSCDKPIVVITRRAYCFHDYIFLHIPFNIKNKEKWTPKEMQHAVNKYRAIANIDLVVNDINTLVKPTKKLKSNLTRKGHFVMKELAKRKDLILVNADKVVAVVIMDTDSYIKEANRQLSDKASYKQLTQDSTLQHEAMVEQTIQRFKNGKLVPTKKLQMA